MIRDGPDRGYLVGAPQLKRTEFAGMAACVCAAVLLLVLLLVPVRFESAVDRSVRSSLANNGINSDDLVIDVDWRSVVLSTDSTVAGMAAADALAENRILDQIDVRVPLAPGPVNAVAIQLGERVILSGSLSTPGERDDFERRVGLSLASSQRPVDSFIGDVEPDVPGVAPSGLSLVDDLLPGLRPQVHGSVILIEGQVIVKLSGLTDGEIQALTTLLENRANVRFTLNQ